MITNQTPLENLSGYTQLKSFYITALKELTAGVTELFLHPAYGGLVREPRPGWTKKIWEYRLLCDEDFHRTIEDEGIIKVSWRNAPLS